MGDETETSGSFGDLDELYQEVILDHYRSPRNKKTLEAPDITVDGLNPYCGDEVSIQASLVDDRVVDIGISGLGCSISQASLSMMSELLKNKSLSDFQRLVSLFKRFLEGTDLSDCETSELGGLEALSGLHKYPIRIKCALLGWTTMEEGILDYRSDNAAK